jgi:hypothetical protein
VATVDAVVAPLSLRTDIQLTPFTPAQALLYARQGINQPIGGGGFAGGGVLIEPGFGRGPVFVGGEVVQPQEQMVRLRRGPVWIRTVVIYVVLAGLALMRSARIVTAPAREQVRTKGGKNAAT